MISSGWAQLMFKLIRKTSAAAMSIKLCIFNARVKQGSSGAPCLFSERHISRFIDTSTGKPLLGAVGAKGIAILWRNACLCQCREKNIDTFHSRSSWVKITFAIWGINTTEMWNSSPPKMSDSILQFNFCSAARRLLVTNEETSSVGLNTFCVPAIICASPLMPGGIWN